VKPAKEPLGPDGVRALVAARKLKLQERAAAQSYLGEAAQSYLGEAVGEYKGEGFSEYTREIAGRAANQGQTYSGVQGVVSGVDRHDTEKETRAAALEVTSEEKETPAEPAVGKKRDLRRITPDLVGPAKTQKPKTKRVARVTALTFTPNTLPLEGFGAVVGAIERRADTNGARKKKNPTNHGWDAWRRYCDSLQSLPVGHNNILRGVIEGDARDIVAHFAYSLRERNETLQQIWTTLSNTSAGFFRSGETSRGRDLFTVDGNPALAKILKLCQPTVGERRNAVSSWLENEKLPIPEELEDAAYNLLWKENNWEDITGLDSRGACAMGLVSVAFGARPSNLVKLNAQNGHYLREEDVRFEVETVKADGTAGSELYTCGSQLREALGLTGSGVVSDATLVTRVVGISFWFLTSKPSSMQRDGGLASGTYAHWLRRGCRREVRALECVVLWELNRGIGASSDPFFCRNKLGRTLKTRQIRIEDWVEALQQAAEPLGLPAKRFTARSSRVTLASVGQAAGATAAEINLVGGWAVGSTVAAGSYAKGTADNTFSLTARGGNAAGVSLKAVQHRRKSSAKGGK
jgi:hypothetical protein